MRRDSAQFRCARHRGTVVTGRMRRHAALRSFIIKRKNGISCTPCLEGPDLLKIFALKKQGHPTRVIQPRIRQDGCAMNVWANPIVRRANAIEIELHDGSYLPETSKTNVRFFRLRLDCTNVPRRAEADVSRCLQSSRS